MKSVRLIKILASFPNDVADEAERLDVIAQRLNSILGDSRNIRIEIIRWDRNVHAGVGGDLQEVVNVQIGDDYDILVATFWGRAGTPTPRAESGSIEEVKSALRRRKATGSPQVLAYMKTAGLDPLSIDPVQLQTLKSFRDWLGAEGVLFKTFEDSTSYESLVLVELSQVVFEILDGESQPIAISASEPRAIDDGIEDELGFFDYIDSFETSSERMKELMDEQSAALSRLTEHNENATRDVEIAGSDQAAIRRIIRKSAEAWNHYCDTSEKRLARLEKVTDDAFQSMASAIAMGSSSSAEEEELIQNLQALLTTLVSSTASVRSLRDTTAGFPRLTVEHNRAKRRLVAVLDKQISYLERTQTFVSDISTSLESRHNN